MQYTKPMIDQVFQIRKAVPDHLRAQIKLTDPHLLDILADIYREFHDKLLRELIAQLMSMAGPTWLSLLDKPTPTARANPNQRIYRGQIRQTEEPLPTDTPSKPANPAGHKEKLVIYRGQVVHS